MRYYLSVFLLFFSFFNGGAQNFGGNPASVNWYQLNTKNLRLIFPKGLDSQAQRIVAVMNGLGNTTAKSIGGKQKKWNIILQNQTIIPNAYVRLAPVMSELYMTPSQNNFSTGSIRWDDNLIIHENRHIQQLSNFNKGLSGLFSIFLGQEGQLLANGITIPDYFFEGDAVWQETLVSSQGRGRMPSFYNGFKSLWLGNKDYRWMKLRSGSFKDFVPDHYALGYLLTAYGYQKYGEAFWNKVTEDAVRYKGLFYSFNMSIERHSGRSYLQFRNDALQHFKKTALPEEPKTTTEYIYLTHKQKNNVVDYEFAQYISDDSILFSKKSYKEIPGFYILTNGKQTRLRVMDIRIDDHFNYRNGKIVYAAFQADARWANRDYSVLQVLDLYTGRQKQVTQRSKYFSPDINAQGTEIIAVHVQPDGNNNLDRIDVQSGRVIHKIPNPHNYFFTQTRYINDGTAVSAVRNKEGKMGLVKIDLATGLSENLTAFSFNLVGYPLVKGDTVYFSAMHDEADKIYAVSLRHNTLYRLTNNINGIYYPAVNSKGELLFSAFTADGYRLVQMNLKMADWEEVSEDMFARNSDRFMADSLANFSGAGLLNNLDENSMEKDSNRNGKPAVTKYKKSFRLFNVHSWRPVVNEPEYGYSLYSDNVLSSFSNALTYTYNRSDKSHTVGMNTAFAGWFPVLGLGIEESFNRTVDTALGKSVSFNAATVKAGISIPLRFIHGRTSKFLQFGAGFNMEQYYYKGVGKNVLNNKSINYLNSFLSFSNVGQSASQQIYPAWAQSLTLNYRNAVTFRDSYKLVAHSSLYFPGLFKNHSLVINGAYQKRDSLPDLFSKNFAYSRGYEALSTRRMYKLGVNYHFPLVYPDWGFANMVYFLRIRADVFYDHTQAKARVNNILTEIKSRSTGAEIYFDTKVWNTLPVSFGIRFAHLLDTDLLNRGVKNRWELIIPIGIIPD